MSITDYIPRYIKLSDGHAWVKTVRAKDGSRVRVLEVGGVYQSATYLDECWAEPVFEYYRSFDAVFDVVPEASRVLMIGGGGYSWPKHVAATRTGVELDVVELEPAITEAAKQWFFLDRAIGEHPGAINLIEGDGRAFLDAQLDRAVFDAIVLDAFAGIEPVQSLATCEAACAAKKNLTANGVLAANVVSSNGGDVGFLQDLVATWQEVFTNVCVVLCDEDQFAFEDNYLVLGTDNKASKPLNTIAYDDDFLGSVMHD